MFFKCLNGKSQVKAIHIHLLLFGLILAGCSNSTSPGSAKSTISKSVKKQPLEKATAIVGWQPYGSRYAIIVMSSGRNSDKYFWPVTKSMYSYLRTMGFDKEDIRFLAPSKYATNYPDIVSGEAVETKIEEAYKWAKSVCTPEDLLYIFWISHGTASDFTTAGNSVTHSTLRAWMQGITAKQIIGVYQPCHSGAVIDDICGENIITTTSTNLTAGNNWPWAENIAFAVAGPPYSDQWMNPNHELEPAKYSADHDGDGQVSMTEAYIWVAKHRYTEGSMFDDNGDGIGGQWAEDTFDPNNPNKDGYRGNHYSLRGWKPISSAAVKSDSGSVKDEIAASIDAKQYEYAHIAKEIWGFAELAFSEVKSSSLLQATLKAEGFTVEAGVAELETAFVATYRKGKPIIGILAEFDALPGLSQDAVPERKALVENGPGHGCGHNLFGTGSVAAAVAVKDWLAKSGNTGTIRLYGTPAEEQGAGKVFMAQAGLFDDVDVILHLHPYDRNSAGPIITSGAIEAKFRFYGTASHAAEAPERGRSALDGVEAMNHMVNLLREHVPSDSRIHYVVTYGGGAPNVVPASAEVHYYVRHREAEVLRDIWSRVVDAAEGAARGTGTRVEYEIVGCKHSVLANETLAKLLDKNLRLVGGVTYTPQERAFARAIRESLGKDSNDLSMATAIQPYEVEKAMGSSDVGDVSMIAPTAEVDTAAWVPGTGFHTWQATAASGMSIGTKGMIVAAKVMAFTAVDVFTSPSIVKQARDELVEKRGADFEYRPICLRSRVPN